MVNRLTKFAPFILSALGLVFLILVYTGEWTTRNDSCESNSALYVNGEFVECLRARKQR